MAAVVLDIIRAITTADEISLVEATINAINSLKDDDGGLVLFSRSTTNINKANFQIHLAREKEGVVTLKTGAFHFDSTNNVTRVLFFSWSSATAHLYKESQSPVLNLQVYNRVRDAIVTKLGDRAQIFVRDLPIGP